MNKNLLTVKRFQKGYSVNEFIQKCGISTSHYYRLLKNDFKRIDLETAWRIREVLNLSEMDFNEIFFDKKISN